MIQYDVIRKGGKLI